MSAQVYLRDCDSADAKVRYSEFAGNDGDILGGAVLAENSNARLEQCAFSSNAADDGGAVASGAARKQNASKQRSLHLFFSLDARRGRAADAGGTSRAGPSPTPARTCASRATRACRCTS